jgi:hypothetical protein
MMRTTLDIDDDVLAAAKEMARIERVSAGKIVTKLLRLAMSGALDGTAETTEPVVGGFRPFAPSGRAVTNEAIDKLRDLEGV